MRNYYYDAARTLFAAGTLGVSAVRQARQEPEGFIGPLNQKERMGKHTGVVNKQAGRAAMRTKGKKNMKSARGTKNVDVPKRLRKQIKQVVQSGKVYGSYTTSKVGQIGMMQDLTTPQSSSDVLTIGGYAGTPMNFTHGSATVSNSRWWWAGLPQAAAVRLGEDWNYFTPAKILDAASVIWNNKASVIDYTSTAGNFYTVVTEATGADLVATVPLPNLQGNKMFVKNAYVKVEMKNNSQRTYYIDIYHCTPKMMFPEKLPLDAFIDGCVALQSDTVNRLLTTTQTTAALVTDNLVNDPNVQPNMIPAFSSMWKYEKIEMSLAAGETCVHYIQGPKNFELDYNKLYPGGVDKTAFLYKKGSVSVMMAIRPDLQYATAGAAGTTGSGRFMFGGAANDALVTPISMEITETYKMTMPENSGFFQHALAIGSTQQLNLRKKQLAFGNFCAAQTSGIVYGQFNEENPAAAIAASATN